MKRLIWTLSAPLLLFATAAAQNSDDCAGATALALGLNAIDTTGATASGVMANVGVPYVDNATPDTDCQDFNGMPGNLNLDVFYTFTPATNDIYLFSTCNMASVDTKVAAYTGTCNALTAVSCNDDGVGCAAFSSELRVTMTSGTPYTIQIGAFGAAEAGTSTLDVSAGLPQPPANDDCANAQVETVTMYPHTFTTDTAASTVSGIPAGPLPPYNGDNNTPNQGCEDLNGNGTAFVENMNNDVWYEVTLPTSGNFSFSTCNGGMNGSSASYDTKLAIYSGNCGGATAISCNDDGDGCAGFSSNLFVDGLTAGTPYLLAVGGFNMVETGTSTVAITETVAPTLGTPYCASAPNGNSPTGASMSATGSTSVIANDLTLNAGPIQPNQPGIFYFGPDQPLNPSGIPFGEGNRCVVGTTTRLAPTVADALGNLSRTLDNMGGPFQGGPTGTFPGFMAGGVWNFQAWFRDPACVGATSGLAGDCNDDGNATGFNLSNGLEVTFTM